MKNKISVVIPSFNTPKDHLETLVNSLLNQTCQDFEVIIVDDCSEFNYYDILNDHRFKLVRKTTNSGPAESRNIGAQTTSSDIIFFTDSDCELAPETLQNILKNIENEDILMGNTITKASSFLGNAIAYLGFPGGGILGFDRVWRVDENGYTNSLSSCNMAIKKEVFINTGQFDTDFPVPGGEDTVFAQTALSKGYRIKYLPSQIVYHVEKNSLKGFIKWQITRGRGNYYIKKKLGKVGNFLKLRLWSFKNSILSAGFIYAPVVIMLILASAYYQIKGYNIEKRKNG